MNESTIELLFVAAIRDRVVDAFADPVIFANEAAAIRSFKQSCAQSPIWSDLELFALGTYDRKRGVFKPLENPSFITSGGAILHE